MHQMSLDIFIEIESDFFFLLLCMWK